MWGNKMKLSQPGRQEMTMVEFPTACRRRRKTESLFSDQSRKLRYGLLTAWACYSNATIVCKTGQKLEFFFFFFVVLDESDSDSVDLLICCAWVAYWTAVVMNGCCNYIITFVKA